MIPLLVISYLYLSHINTDSSTGIGIGICMDDWAILVWESVSVWFFEQYWYQNQYWYQYQYRYEGIARAHSIAWQASACALNGKESKCADQMVTTYLKIKGWIWTSNRSKKNLLPIIPEPSLFIFNVLPLSLSVHYYLSAWSPYHSASIIFLSLCSHNLLVIMHIITLLLCAYILLVIMRAWYPSHSARIVSISFCFCMDCRKPQPGRVLKICLADSRSCKNHIHGCSSLHITHTHDK